MMGFRRCFAFTLAIALFFAAAMPGFAQESEDSASTEAPVAAPTIEDPNANALQMLQGAIQGAAEAIQTSTGAAYPPSMPALMRDAATRGAQITWMGERNGFNGWLMVDKGVPSYVYISQDEQTVFQGLMFDGTGNPITLGQVAEAQMRYPELLGGADQAGAQPSQTQNQPVADAQSGTRKAGEVLYDALSIANYVTLGAKNPGAPILYAFIDPDCPHCKDFLKAVDKPYLQSGKMELRVLPIGFMGEISKRRAAWILSQADGGAALMEHVRGNKDIPAPEGVTLDGQQLNLDLFTMWKFDGTPILVYKGADNRIMMVRGNPNSIDRVFESIAK